MSKAVRKALRLEMRGKTCASDGRYGCVRPYLRRLGIDDYREEIRTIPRCFVALVKCICRRRVAKGVVKFADSVWKLVRLRGNVLKVCLVLSYHFQDGHNA